MHTVALLVALACSQLYPRVGMPGGTLGNIHLEAGASTWGSFGSSTWSGGPTPSFTCIEVMGYGYPYYSDGSGFNGTDNFSTADNPITDDGFSATGGIIYAYDYVIGPPAKMFTYTSATSNSILGLSPLIPDAWVNDILYFHPGGLLCNGSLSGVPGLSDGGSQGGTTVIGASSGDWNNAGFSQGGGQMAWVCGDTNCQGEAVTCYATTASVDHYNITLGTATPATFDCVTAQPIIGGLSSSVTGQPTGTASPFFYPTWTDHWGSEVFNGDNSSRDLGNIPASAGSMWIGMDFCLPTVTGTTVPIAGKNVGGSPGPDGVTWMLYYSSGSLYFEIGAHGPLVSTLNLGTVVANRCYTAVVAYVGVADGTSIIRGNVSGYVPNEVTNAHFPLTVNNEHVWLGGVHGTYFGQVSISKFSYGTDTLSAATISQMVSGEIGILSTKPVTKQTYTGPGGFCTPTSYQWGWWAPVNTPCIKSTGIDLHGLSSNLLLQSQTIATGTAFTTPWYAQNIGGAALPTTNANQAMAPDGSMTAALVNFGSINGATQTSSIYQQPSISISVVYTASIYAKTVSGTGTLYLMEYSGGPSSTACTLTTAWKRCSTSITAGLSFMTFVIGPDQADDPAQPSNQPALSVYLWGGQLEAAATPGRYQATISSIFSGPADVLTIAQAYGANYYSLDKGIWTTISTDPIVVPMGTHTSLTQCSTTLCAK